MVTTELNQLTYVQHILNCTEQRAQLFVDAADGDDAYLAWLIEREIIKQTTTPAVVEF